MYRNLPNNTEKKRFISAFQAGGKGKDMSFLQSFQKTVSDVTGHVAKTTENFYNMHQILTMNALDPSTMDDDQKKRIMKILIEQSEREHDYKSKVIECPEEPLLTRYFYIMGTGVERSRGRTETDTTIDKFEGSDLHALEASGSSNVGNIAIKLENPEYNQFLQELTVLKSAKKVIENLANAAQDLHSTLGAKATKDPSLIVKVEEVEHVVTKVNAFLQDSYDL